MDLFAHDQDARSHVRRHVLDRKGKKGFPGQNLSVRPRREEFLSEFLFSRGKAFSRLVVVVSEADRSRGFSGFFRFHDDQLGKASRGLQTSDLDGFYSVIVAYWIGESSHGVVELMSA